MRYANDLGSKAHVQMMQSCKPGMMEYQLESSFLHHCYVNGGARKAAYTPIAASGLNGAVLHYGHEGCPNSKWGTLYPYGMSESSFCCFTLLVYRQYLNSSIPYVTMLLTSGTIFFQHNHTVAYHIMCKIQFLYYKVFAWESGVSNSCLLVFAWLH